mgnify:CR=1 FL=1
MGFFNEPHGVAALPWGEIAVSDTYNNRVQIFDQNGGLRAPELTPLRKRDINLSLSLYPPLRVFPIPLCVKFRSLSVQGHFACALAHRGESSCQFIPSLTGRLLLPRPAWSNPTYQSRHRGAMCRPLIGTSRSRRLPRKLHLLRQNHRRHWLMRLCPVGTGLFPRCSPPHAHSVHFIPRYQLHLKTMTSLPLPSKRRARQPPKTSHTWRLETNVETQPAPRPAQLSGYRLPLQRGNRTPVRTQCFATSFVASLRRQVLMVAT